MAYRRCLSTRATLLAGRLNPAPSFTYISHHDSDRTKHGEFHSSGPKIESYLAQRRCFGSYFNNTSGQFTGTFCRTGYGFIGNGMLLNRYMSTSIGEADNISFPSNVAPVVTDDVASVITDTSITMEAVASQASAMSVDTIADPEFGLLGFPSYIIEHLMHGVHSFTGLNWWASIALTTLLVRGVTIPFLVYELKASSKFELMMSRREEIKTEMRARGMKPQAVEEGNKKMDELCKEYGVNRYDPDAQLMGLVVEGSLICSFLIATLRMVRDAPSLNTGGALWFIDLTTTDVTGALPSLLVLTLWGMVSFIWNDRQGDRATLSLVIVLVSGICPNATVLCFLTSDVWSLCFGCMLRNPSVKKALGIPEIPVSPPSSTGDKLSRMIKNFWKVLNLQKQRDANEAPQKLFVVLLKGTPSDHKCLKFIWNDRQGVRALWSMSYVVLSALLPKATVLCFLTSDVFSLWFGCMLRIPSVKKAFGIPEIPVAPPSSAADKLERMIKKVIKEAKESE